MNPNLGQVRDRRKEKAFLLVAINITYSRMIVLFTTLNIEVDNEKT